MTPRDGGTHLYLKVGTIRDATREVGDWDTPSVMERVRRTARAEEVATGMRGDIDRACSMWGMEESVKDSEHGVSFDDKGVVGLAAGPYPRLGFRHFCTPKGYLAPCGRFGHLSEPLQCDGPSRE